MNRGKSWELADKMLADMETLLDHLRLTKKQREAAHRMSEQVMVYAAKLRKEHAVGGVRRSPKLEIAALGMAAMLRAMVHRMGSR